MTPPELHPAIGPNRYCGPGALAMLTGKDTATTAAALREVSGRRAIKGTWSHYMLAAHSHLTGTGLVLADDRRGQRCPPMLAKWALGQEPGRYLVEVTGHYVVVRVTPEGIEVGDNQSVYPVPLDQFRRRRKRVQRAWRVRERG